MKKLAVVVGLILATSTALADEPKHFSVMFQSTETNVTEASWQALNVIDAMQTDQIAKNPKCYQEVGTLSLLTGNHPTTHQAILGSALFGVLHYGVAKLIDYTDSPTIQRIYQYGGLIFKGWNDNRNREIGLGLNHSRGC